MWALGDYPAVAAHLIPDLGTILVQACGIGPGDRVLDVAAGAGNAAIPAALAGAGVVALDLTPELLDAGRAPAAERAPSWNGGSVMRRTSRSPTANSTSSCRVSGSCSRRTTRPARTSWSGYVGRAARSGCSAGRRRIRRADVRDDEALCAAAASRGQPPPLWGSEDHVRALFGDNVSDVDAHRQTVRIGQFASPAEFLDYFKAHYGPTIAAYRGIADDPNRVAALDRDLADLAERHQRAAGSTAMEWEYLLLTGRKRG